MLPAKAVFPSGLGYDVVVDTTHRGFLFRCGAAARPRQRRDQALPGFAGVRARQAGRLAVAFAHSALLAASARARPPPCALRWLAPASGNVTFGTCGAGTTTAGNTALTFFRMAGDVQLPTANATLVG